jgi:hypothetical protein
MLTDYTAESEVTQYLPKAVTTSNGRELPLFDSEGKVISANLPAVVPGRYIKAAEYNGDAEIFACMDVPLVIDNQEIRPPSLGVWSLLETFASPFVANFGAGLDLIHAYRALYINEHRQDIAADVQQWRFEFDDAAFDIEDPATWTSFDTNVLEYAQSLKFDMANHNNWWAIRMFFELSFNGYSMIPPSGGGGKFIYGAESMGSTIAAIGQSLNIPFKELLWQTPMIIIGHTAAGLARMNGVTGVSRPKCREDIRKQLLLATAREYKGELHPWQIESPLTSRLTGIQSQSETLKAEFEQLRAKAAKKAGKKV